VPVRAGTRRRITFIHLKNIASILGLAVDMGCILCLSSCITRHSAVLHPAPVHRPAYYERRASLASQFEQVQVESKLYSKVALHFRSPLAFPCPATGLCTTTSQARN
jgi:hypothetical protein